MRPKAGMTFTQALVGLIFLGLLGIVVHSQFKSFLKRSWQSEIRMALAATHEGEQVVHADRKTYVSCLGTLVYRTKNDIHFAFGWSDEAATSPNCSPNGIEGLNPEYKKCTIHSWTPGDYGSLVPVGYCNPGKGVTWFAAEYSEGIPSRPIDQSMLGGQISWNTYQLHALGYIGDKEPDHWMIDHTKKIQQLPPPSQ